MKHFKIKTGYGKGDFIQIDETELAMAMRAQVNGGVCITKNGTVSGNSIMQILPDWNKLMGWKTEYQLTGEDWEEIGIERQKSYRDFLLNAKLTIEGRKVEVKSLEK